MAAGPRPLLFGLSLTQLLEVTEPPPLTVIPGAPEFVRGVVAWRDQPVPVLDLAQRLGLPAVHPEDGERRRLLVAHEPGHTPIAFLVRSAVRILRLPLPHQTCAGPLPIHPALLRASVELEHETVVVPHLDAILAGTPR
jgi:chemotaxis signal transduction protein